MVKLAHDAGLAQEVLPLLLRVAGLQGLDGYGHVAPGMEPFWHLGGVASSFVMLKAIKSCIKFSHLNRLKS
jgi:hypothetical protein